MLLNILPLVLAWCISLPALGDPIALFIIDMQPTFAERYDYNRDEQNVEKIRSVHERQVELIRLAIEAEAHIILVEYQDSGPTVQVLRDAIGSYPRTVTFVKKQDGMFESRSGVAREIKRYLDSNGIRDLVIAGANGGACVRCSIAGALNLGYRVWADNEGIIDFNFREFVLPYHYYEGDFRLGYFGWFRNKNFNQPHTRDDISAVIKNNTIQTNTRGCAIAWSVLSFLPFHHLFSGWRWVK